MPEPTLLVGILAPFPTGAILAYVGKESRRAIVAFSIWWDA